MTIRALVVDDSALIRKVLSDILDKDPKIEVIGTAINGKDALEKIENSRPDIVLLDNVMPVLDGLKTLARIMKEYPTPVVMVSALGEKAEEITLTAFEYGAVDVIEKPGGILSHSIPEMAEEICKKVRAAAKANLGNLGCMCDPESNKPEKIEKEEGKTRGSVSPVKNVLAIGASTGGPRALEKLISALPASLPAAVLVVQHMPPGFTASFSKRLDAKSSLRVREAKEGDEVEEGVVLVAPGDYHMEIVRKMINGLQREVVHLNRGPKELGTRPSVNVLFRSIAPIYGPRIISLILTGMNCDGAEGAEEIKKMGGKVIAEARSSCVVYGMPGEIVRRKLADLVLPLDRMAAELLNIMEQTSPPLLQKTDD
ncbi:chemotaxis response regulator protein-glutamate methylesterase [Methanosarcina sp. KYL-1]|uniref:protein-glutamate methylesterase/protein-glutamine glutaminase n=1 Tax=Methanosarcina sp. KYL-1 TaxID=2602068 RepID=UPI002100E060|nr:chemotaxis response regulator protein-glutamate methylesterase [Methanosarcina sp. KYL-1]MCQ1535957.1 chemotaxis response regulator protein-glutamate methylesterase [Methanosarcina sp. KYL-1]